MSSPATLPANFNGWDRGDAPATLPPDFDKWDDAPQKKPPTPAPAAAPEPPGFMNTLGREAKSIGGTVAGIIPGAIHAFTDEPTPDEQDFFNGDTKGLKRVGLGIDRLTTQPIRHAVDWYKDAAQGKVANPYENALSVAPEAMGIGAAAPLTEGFGKRIPGAIKSTIENAPNIGKVASVVGKPAAKVGIDLAQSLPIVGKPIEAAVRGAKTFSDVPGQLRDRMRIPNDLVRGSDEIFPSRPEPITPEQAHADAVRRGEIGTMYEPGDILEKPVLGRRESLADRAGIQPGRPEPNIEITRPPEPSGLRERPTAPARSPRPAPAWQAPGASESTPIPSEVTRPLEPGGLRSKIGRPSIGQQQGPKIANYQDNLEDAGIKQSMEDSHNREGMRLRREQIEENSIASKPKWKRVAEVKAQQAAQKIMEEAAVIASKPKKFTETPSIKSPKIATQEDLTSVLKESIRQARKKKP